MWLLLPVALLIFVLVLFAIVVALAAVAIAVISYLLPVLLIVGGVWLLAKAISGADDRRWARRQARSERSRSRRPTAAPVAPRPAQQRPPVRPQASPPRRELPIDVQVKAEQIRHKVDLLLGFADRFPPFSRDLYMVRQTASDYLPRTTAAYLAIPGTNDPLVRGTGRTALEELRAQLAMLDSRLDAITVNLQQHDLDGLLANRRFLEERFGLDDEVSPFESGRRGAGPTAMRSA